MDKSPIQSYLGVLTKDEHANDSLLGLRATIDLAPIGLAQFDVEGRFLLVNDRLCDIFGCTRADVLARTLQEITFPDDLPRCLELTAKLAANEIPNYLLEKRFVRPDGSVVWTRITASAVRRPDGSVAFFIGAAEDITEQVNAAQALSTAEERLQTALSASMIGTFRFDLRRNALEWADGFERVFGSGHRITLDQFFDVIHPDDRAHVMTSYTKSVTEGVDFEEEFRVIWPDGATHWLHDRGRTVLGADGRPHYIVGAITDITNHKRMEEVMREREIRYRKALDVENIGVIFFDNEHRVTGINQAFERMSGYTHAELTDGAVRWQDLAPTDARGLADAGAAEFDATGRTAPYEIELTRKSGTPWWGLVTATRVSEAEGVKFVLDVTDRKNAEREREEVLQREQAARNEAERATAVRQQVLGFVAHDLRNPLHAIVGSASSLLDLPLSSEQRTRRIEVIRRCARDMDRLITDLLDVSRIEAGTFDVRREEVEVPRLLSEVVEGFQEQARSREVQLVSRVEADARRLEGDSQRLAQALSNLVNNAIKFTPPGGRVLIGARQEGAHLEIVVQDTGCGIAPENLPSIFDRFWQANRTSGGAGLGLAIVKGIVESHRGQIHVESAPDRGTTFHLRLPRSGGAVPRS